jgi:hypothetical protein
MYTVSERRAYERGKDQGISDNFQDYYNEAPLSGEWAGYSPKEILGDLFPEYEDTVEYFAESGAICDAYTEGYQSAFVDRVFCDECGTLVNPNDGVTDDVFVYCGSMFGNGCAEKMVA